MTQEQKDEATINALSSHRRSKVAGGIGVASIGGMIAEGLAQAPTDSLLVTAACGLGALAYALHENGVAVDYAERADSPKTVEQVVAETFTTLSTKSI